MAVSFRMNSRVEPFIERPSKVKDPEIAIDTDAIQMTEEDQENPLCITMRALYKKLGGLSKPNLLKLFLQIKELALICFRDGQVESPAVFDPNEMNEFEPRKIAIFLNHFLVSDTKDPIVLGIRQALKQVLVRRVNTFVAQFNFSQLVTTACSLEFVQCHDIQIFKDLRSRIVESWPKESTSEVISHLTWLAFGFRHEQTRDTVLFQKIGDCFGSNQIRDLSNEELVRLIKAFTYAKYKYKSLYALVAKEVMKRDFTTCQAADIYWSFAYIVDKDKDGGGYTKENCKDLIFHLKKCVSRKFDQLNSNQITRLTWCESAFKIDDPAFANALTDRTIAIINMFTVKELVTSVKKFSQVKELNPNILMALIQASMVKIDEFEPTHLTQLAYGLLSQYCSLNSTMGNQWESSIKKWLERIFDANSTDFDEFDLSRIDSIYRIYYGKTQDQSLIMPAALRRIIDEHFVKLRQETPQSSRFHRDVAHHLGQFKPGFVNEHFFFGYRIDIAYVDEKIAIEVDGNAFHKDQNMMPLAKERIKEYLLGLYGWQLYRVSSTEWYKNVGKHQKIAFLMNRLPF